MERSGITGKDRKQLQLLPSSIEEYVDEANPVRVMDAYVDTLDFVKLGFQKAVLADVGRLPYHVGSLLKLYLYGYFYGVRSSRKLEAETQRNLEVMWLLRDLRPDDKTISNFRRENAKAIRGVFVEFRILCQNLKLYGNETVAIDGSKFKASNSKKRSFTQESLKKRIQEIEEHVTKFLQEVENNDTEELKVPKADAEELKQKLDNLEEKLAEYRRLYAEMEEQKESQVSLTDPDSRRMRTSQGASSVSYNVQMSADSKHGMIVDYKTTNECTDIDQLKEMAILSKEALGVETIEVLADTGYSNGSQIAQCDKNGITTFIPEKSAAGLPKRNGLPTQEYTVDKFNYNAKNDCYTCPQGQILVMIRRAIHEGEPVKFYQTTACDNCPARSKCTESPKGRTVRRTEGNDALDACRERVKENPDKSRLRGQLIEPIFGIMKGPLALNQFFLRGLSKVDTEVGLTSLAYNLKRAIAIVSVPVLLQEIAKMG